MAKRRAMRGDVYWYVLGRKTPIAYSTKAASDLIVALGEDGATIQEIYDQINYDVEARAVLEKYIARGFCAIQVRKFFR